MLKLLVKIVGRSTPVVTHPRLHLDEIIAILEMQMFGTIKWLAEHAAEGIYLGINFPDGRLSEFNEHGREGKDSCATLIARSLGLLQDPLLARGLEASRLHDKEAKGHNELAMFINTWHMVNIMRRVRDADPMVINWSLQALYAWFYGQIKRADLIRQWRDLPAMEASRRLNAEDRADGGIFGLERLRKLVREFHPTDVADEWEATLEHVLRCQQELLEDTRAEIAAKAKIITIEVKGQVFRIMVIESDDQLLAQVVFSRQAEDEPRVDVLFIINGTGHCQILPNKSSKLTLRPTIVALRKYLAEMMIRRGLLERSEMPTPEQLAMECFTPHLDRIFWQGIGKPILNGSRARRDILPLLGPEGLLTQRTMIAKLRQGVTEELAARTSSDASA